MDELDYKEICRACEWKLKSLRSTIMRISGIQIGHELMITSDISEKISDIVKELDIFEETLLGSLNFLKDHIQVKPKITGETK